MEQYPDFFGDPYERYVEPFLGGGAVFFTAKPKNALLSDINHELIECYRVVRDDPEKLVEILAIHHERHSKDYYYSIRSTPIDDRIEKAGRFIYLNRTCFNGLYRVNLLGNFNVPKGTKSSVLLPTDDFLAVSSALKRVELCVGDFESIVSRCGSGDFLYLDPPYTANHNNNGFLKYNEKIFSWDDQKRLKAAALDAAKRGARVVVSNAAHSSVVDLYKDAGEIMTVSRSSVLAANRNKRGKVQEILVVMG